MELTASGIRNFYSHEFDKALAALQNASVSSNSAVKLSILEEESSENDTVVLATTEMPNGPASHGVVLRGKLSLIEAAPQTKPALVHWLTELRMHDEGIEDKE